jgi:hypothetical protein
LLDTVRSKRAAVVLGALMIAAAALTIALWPAFPVVLAALAPQVISGGFLGLAVAAMSLGLVGHAALGERLGRNQRFASTGRLLAGCYKTATSACHPWQLAEPSTYNVWLVSKLTVERMRA